MKVIRSSVQLRIPALIAALLLSANLGVAQEASQPPQQPSSSTGGVRVDPSAGPLKPGGPVTGQPAQSQAPLPEAPQPVPPAQSASQPAQPASQEPLGAAAAEQIKTAGGGASRPAGSAIAPVKQHQYRSFLIKFGAVAAAGIAAGTVYGLSHATPSTPPHSASASAK